MEIWKGVGSCSISPEPCHCPQLLCTAPHSFLGQGRDPPLLRQNQRVSQGNLKYKTPFILTR